MPIFLPITEFVIIFFCEKIVFKKLQPCKNLILLHLTLRSVFQLKDWIQIYGF